MNRAERRRQERSERRGEVPVTKAEPAPEETQQVEFEVPAINLAGANVEVGKLPIDESKGMLTIGPVMLVLPFDENGRKQLLGMILRDASQETRDEATEFLAGGVKVARTMAEALKG